MDIVLMRESFLSGLKSRVFIKNRNLEFTYCNGAFARDLDIPPQKVIGTDDFVHYPEELALNNRKEDRHVLNTGRSLNHIKRIRSRGKDLWIRVSKEAFVDDTGQIVGVIGILEDIPYEQSCWGIGSPGNLMDCNGSTQTPFIVWEWEVGTDSLTFSENTEDVLGEKLVLDKRRGCHPADVVYEEDRDRVVTELRRAVRDRRFFSMELRIPIKQGVKWFYTTGGVIVSKRDGKPRLYGIARDISGWKSDDKSFNPYRSAYENSTVPILFSDMEGNLIHCNSAFLELWNINSSRDLQGCRIHNFWVHNAGVDEIIRKELENRHSWKGEIDALRADNTVFRASVVLNKLKDSQGRSLNIAVTIQDVSERKALEDDNRILSGRFESLIKTTSDGFWVYNHQGKILEVNDRLCELLGYERDVLTRMSTYELDLYVSKSIVVSRCRDVQNKRNLQYKSRLKSRTGKILDMDISTVYCPEGDIFFAFLKDITERVNLMKELVYTKQNLEETNTALRVVINNREKESAENYKSINRIVQKTVMPLLHQLKLDNAGRSEDILDQVISNLQKIQKSSESRLAEKLNTREFQIARYIVQGLSSKEIADLMGMSLRTVESYRLSIRDKLKLKNSHRNLRSELENLLI